MKKIIGFLLLMTGVFFSCKRTSFDAAKQAQIDDDKIKAFIAANNIPAIKDTTGLYYVISNPGSGTVKYSTNTNVKVKYILRLLDGTEIPQTTEAIDFYLGGVILGWQYGIPKIQPGGKIRLIVPSGLAYGNYAQGNIPANSVLDFDVELIAINP